MTDTTTLAPPPEMPVAKADRRGLTFTERASGWLPTWPMISTKLLELRKRRGMMIAVVLLIFGLPVIVLGLRLLFHAVDPKSYGPAGSPSVFTGAVDVMGGFGFIAAAALGATAGVSDLSEGMFRHLVITGRSRLSLYLARIPAGLSILVPLVAVAFTLVCLVTCYEGQSQPRSLSVGPGLSLPVNLSESQLKTVLLKHPSDLSVIEQQNGPPRGKVIQTGPNTFQSVGPPTLSRAAAINQIDHKMPTIYAEYLGAEYGAINPPINEMVKIGLWLELMIGVGFLVGLGLGSLIGQRTVTTILMIAVQLIVTPLLASTVIPYFINGQRLFVGLAMDQLRPFYINPTFGGGGNGPFGGRIGVPPMPEWAMIAVIVGWLVGWSAIGARRMVTRDA